MALAFRGGDGVGYPPPVGRDELKGELWRTHTYVVLLMYFTCCAERMHVGHAEHTRNTAHALCSPYLSPCASTVPHSYTSTRMLVRTTKSSNETPGTRRYTFLSSPFKSSRVKSKSEANYYLKAHGRLPAVQSGCKGA